MQGTPGKEFHVEIGTMKKDVSKFITLRHENTVMPT